MNSRCISVLLLVQLSLVYGHSDASFRIFNGSPLKIENAKYMVHVHSVDKQCGGTLISLRHVVTAAHCVYKIPKDFITVAAGRTNLKEYSSAWQYQHVDEIFIPDTYKEEQRIMDIAVLLLSGSFTASEYVGSTKLCEKPLKAGDKIRISGWGWTAENSNTAVDVLRAGFVQIVDWKTCANKYKNSDINFTEEKICAGNGEVDRCTGDSGGPGINYKGELCAVILEGKGCGQPAYPGIYVNVMDCNVQKFLKESLEK